MDNAGEQASTGSIPPVGHRTIQADTTAPDGSEIRTLIDHNHGAGRASLVEVSLLAGQVSRPVWHRQVEEIWYILEGHGQVWRCPFGTDPTDVMPLAVGPGDVLTIPTRWRFQFSASSGESLRFLCFTTPPWPGADEAHSAEAGGLGPPTI